jgi:two-component system, response regulator
MLLVEDNPRDVELTLDALIDSGMTGDVTVLSDGEEVLDYIYRRGRYRMRRPEPPSIVLLDVKMPKLNGLEVLKQLKSDEETRDIPIVMLTSSGQEQDFIAAFDLAADGYVTKPVKPEHLAKTIETTIASRWR